jgi:hypothetical protein
MEFSTEFWTNHKRGMKKRAEISNYLSKNPTANVELILPVNNELMINKMEEETKEKSSND